MTPEQRADPRAARRVLEKLIPKRYLPGTVALLARAVVAAHSRDRFKWSITLSEDFIRLNMGLIEVLSIQRGVITLIVNGARARSVIDPEDVVDGGFKSVPSAAGVRFVVGAIKSHVDILWDAFEANLHEASLTPRHPSAKRAHSPGLLRLLTEQTHTDVPNPVWAV